MTDVLGHRMKFGLLVPSTNTVVQPELEAMRPVGVTNHCSRIHIANDPLATDADFAALIARIQDATFDAIDRVMTCGPGAVILGMSAETFWDGAGGSEEMKDRLEGQAGVPVVMASDALLAALRTLGAGRRIAVLSPYMPIADARVRAFFEGNGFEVANLIGLRSSSPQHTAHISEAELRDTVRALDGPDVDAIVQVGTNLAFARVATMAEFWLGKPVLSVNVATYWHALRSAGIGDAVAGFGPLLERH